MIASIFIVSEVIGQDMLTYTSTNSEIESKKTARNLTTFWRDYSKKNIPL